MTDTTAHAKKRLPAGWCVALSGLGVNLALGVLYSWSVFASALWARGWTATQTQLPYMVACAVFAVMMVPGGRLQDRFGPRPVLIAASLLTGAGFVLSGLFLSLEGLLIFFGVIFGAAMAFGYACTTPAAIKWFCPQKRGLVSGIVVSGFGLAGIYVAPLTNFLLHTFTLELAFIVLGVFYCIIIFLLHFLVKNPPADYIPEPSPVKKIINKVSSNDFTVKQMMKTFGFYALWLMFFCGTFAGLKVLGQLSNIGKEQAALSLHEASLLVMIYALFNCIGRFLCGILSDKIGRKITLSSIFLMQVITYMFFSQLNTFATLAAGTVLIAFSFGGMLTLFPSLTADYFGLKNLGLNYGIVFTAWGVGGVLGPLVGGIVRDRTQMFDLGYIISLAVCIVGFVLSLLTRSPKTKDQSR